MTLNKKIFAGMFFLFAAVFFFDFSSAEFAISNPQFSVPGANSLNYLGRQGINAFPIFNSNQCQNGQDFIIQVAPFGCTPAVVRSDLLEEQNVPVFCQLYATKINPLISVEAIDSISFSGSYPKEVSGIGFHPARAAVRSTQTTLLNSPILQNIGYAVIVLKQNQNESSMPDFVSGNLTANIRYDIQNAFGIGPATQYLPEFNAQQWDEKYSQYSFWNGKGFLKADGITNDGAVISIYSDKNNKISTLNLRKGDASGDIYLPGFYCQAGLKLRLDDVRTPETRARLNINGEIVEVVEGEQFLDNKCTAGYVNKKGIFKETEITCRTDTGFERFSLKINPTLILDIDGEKKTVNLGDKLYTNADGKKSVYLAYIGMKGDSSNSDDLFVYLMETPQFKNNLTKEELESAKFLINNLIYKRVTGGMLADVPVNVLKGYVGLANLIKQYLIDGKDIGRLDFKESGIAVEKSLFGKKVKIVGFAEPRDGEFKDATAKAYYENAMKDYNEIISKFANEKEDSNSQSTFGKDALVGAIDLSIKSQQKKTVTDLCGIFREKYPSNIKDIEDKCSAYQISSQEIAGKGVVINGRTKIISLIDIYEPTPEEFSAEILVRKIDDGTMETHILTRNEVLVLGQNADTLFEFSTSQDFPINPGSGSVDYPIDASGLSLYPGKIYFAFFDGKWKWSSDKINWEELNVLRIKGTQVGKQPAFELRGKSAELLKALGSISDDKYAKGSTLLLEKYGAIIKPYAEGNDFIQLLDLSENSARVKVNIKGVANIISDTLILNKNVGTASGGYVFTPVAINLKKVAKVSVIPNIKNAGTSTNFSFSVGIEKRAIQLSPDKIKERIDSLNHTIADWEKNSEQLGKVVKGFNAACLTVGTTLTIKNLFENFDGRAIARTEVMRSPGGWMDVCKDKVNNKEFSTIDACLLHFSDDIDKDITLVESVIKNQQGITNDNAAVKLAEIKGKLGSQIADPDDKTGKNVISIDGDVASAFTKEGYDEGKISLSQARDIERLKKVIDSSTSEQDELKKLAERKLYKIMSDIKANSVNFNSYTSLQSEMKNSGLNLGVNSYASKNTVQGIYDGGILNGNQISGIQGFNPTTSYPAEIVIYGGKKYAFILDGDGSSSRYYVNREKIYYLDSVSSDGVSLSPANEEDRRTLSTLFSEFVKYDRTSYENKFKDAQVRYFETEPYKGLPAIVPFDTGKGWYAATKQTVSGLGNIRAYDESGRLNSFYLCNVGRNGREEFYSELGDDICRSFNPGTGQVQGEFPGLTQAETNSIVSRATRAVEDASRAYKSGISGKKVSILNEFVSVGSPATGNPNVQCQDFMSPKECLLLFNACDPVVCPSSRCNLGGTYNVPNVIESGIIGSAALCLPNARENIVVPVCLSGIKAGMDGFISVEKNYRDCLQTNLETGKTVGLCDEIHSVYLCDFFWSQAQPLANIIVPKIFEAITGQTGRGGGEYLGVASAWENADKSVQYMTNYYGAASFEAFKTGIIKEVGHSICKSFVSASYPSKMDFFDSIIEPESPPQYTAWFSESTYTTATVPPTSRYKIFYHIFAGKNGGEAGRNSGAFYSVYLKTPQSGSFFQYAPTVTVASGFIPPGEYASETKDFTAPSGYKELCVSVNGKEECGFKQVTTDFGLDYVQDLYKQDVAEKTDINSEKDCVSGTPSLYSFANPNLQSAAQEFVDPSLSLSQIVRICSTDNPGKGTDPSAGTAGGKWIQVGTCDGGKGTLKCYLDRESVTKNIKSLEIKNATLKSVTDSYVDGLIKEGQYFGTGEYDKELTKINGFDNKGKVSYITSDLIGRAFLNGQKAKLIFIRAEAYAKLALDRIGVAKDTSKSSAKLEFDLTTKVGWDACMKKYNDVLTCGNPQIGTQKTSSDVTINPIAGSGQTLINSLESALSELNLILKEGQADFLQYNNVNPNNIEFSKFVDKIHSSNLLSSEEYRQMQEGIGANSRTLKTLLENKLKAERERLKKSDACIIDANWVQSGTQINLGQFVKIDPAKKISPGTAFIQLKINSFDSCKDYTVVVWNPGIFGSDVGYKINSNNFKQQGSEYYLEYKVDAIKQSALNYDPKKYTFRIYNSWNEEVFVGATITVDTNALSEFFRG